MTWSMGLDKNGRPIEAPGARYTTDSDQDLARRRRGAQLAADVVQPDHRFGVLSGQRELGDVRSDAAIGVQVHAGTHEHGARQRRQGPIPDTEYAATQPEVTGRFLVAWDPVKQQERWRVPVWDRGGRGGGTLATAGGLVFSGNAAYDAETGEKLWEEPLLGERPVGWISYMLDGKQYVSRDWLAATRTIGCSRSRWMEARQCLPCLQQRQRREEAAEVRRRSDIARCRVI